MMEEINASDFVLVVCSASYNEKATSRVAGGVRFESGQILQELHEEGMFNERFLPESENPPGLLQRLGTQTSEAGATARVRVSLASPWTGCVAASPLATQRARLRRYSTNGPSSVPTAGRANRSTPSACACPGACSRVIWPSARARRLYDWAGVGAGGRAVAR